MRIHLQLRLVRVFSVHSPFSLLMSAYNINCHNSLAHYRNKENQLKRNIAFYVKIDPVTYLVFLHVINMQHTNSNKMLWTKNNILGFLLIYAMPCLISLNIKKTKFSIIQNQEIFKITNLKWQVTELVLLKKMAKFCSSFLSVEVLSW